jgi:(heptosyl)LPS beta-1,4-glucosyltransferase
MRAWYPDTHLRLFRRDAGHFPDKAVHETWAPFDPATSTGRLRGDLIHDSYRDVSHCVRKWMHYAELGAQDTVRQGPVRSLWPAVGHATLDFFKYHIVKGGFLDGSHGLVYNAIHAFYFFYRYALAYELTKRAAHDGAAPAGSAAHQPEEAHTAHVDRGQAKAGGGG